MSLVPFKKTPPGEAAFIVILLLLIVKEVFKYSPSARMMTSPAFELLIAFFNSVMELTGNVAAFTVIVVKRLKIKI